MNTEAALHRCFYKANMEQIYRRAPIPKCGFNKTALQLY